MPDLTRFFRRGPGSRRAIDRLRLTEAQLAACQEDNARLHAWKTAADDYFQRLTADRHTVYEAWRTEKVRAVDADIAAACIENEHALLSTENARLRAALTAHQARATADSDTVQIAAHGLRQHLALGPAVSLHDSPQAADPTHVPAWAEREPAA